MNVDKSIVPQSDHKNLRCNYSKMTMAAGVGYLNNENNLDFLIMQIVSLLGSLERNECDM